MEKETEGSQIFVNWVKEFKLEEIEKGDIFEMMQMFEGAEGKAKLAFIDLIRLLLSSDKSAGHVVYNHWEEMEINIF